MKKAILIGSSVTLALVVAFTFWINWEYLFLSKNYRAHNSFTHHKKILSEHFQHCVTLDRTPSLQYPFSGGGRINISQVTRMNNSHDGPLYVVNLREDDGFYFDEQPITYYGMHIRDGNFRYHLSTKGRKKWLYGFRKWFHKAPEKIEDLDPSSLETESEILGRLGIHYVKFDLARQRFASKWDFIDNAIALFESLPSNTWIHFHCAGGRGRTTTLMIIYDIFRNAKTASLDDILSHHHCLGGERIQYTHVRPNGSWSKQNLEGRLRLLENFHKYMTSPNGYPHNTWLKWLDEQGLPVEFTVS